MVRYLKYISLSLLVLFSFDSITNANASIANNNLIIKNAKIINPGGNLKPKIGYIIIQNGIIQKVGYGKIARSNNYSIYDANYQYVIPGLIDSHTHIDTVLGLDDKDDTTHTALKNEYRKQLPRSFLYFGYTTLIDLNTSDNNAALVFNANKAHPDLYSCGGGIMIADGYPMSDFPDKVRYKMFPNFLYEANQKNKFVSNQDTESRSPSAIIKRIIKNNAVCIKVFYEPGFNNTNNLPLPSLNSIKKIVAEAHQHHLNVLLHANSITAQQFALDSGIDVLAHGLWNWEVYDGEQNLPSAIQGILANILKKNLGYQPTMQVIKGLDATLNPNYFQDPQLVKVIPKSLLDWYQTDEGQWYIREIINKTPKSSLKKRLLTKEDQLKRVIYYLQQKNGKLLFGTDSPSGPTYGNPPGYNGYLEMKNWYSAGVPLSTILISATIRNAQYFNLDDKYGSIAAGKIANLILMRKNPLKDITAYDSISIVILHGKPYARKYFSAAQS